MKFSEACLAGCATTTGTTGGFYISIDPDHVEACALGAAALSCDPSILNAPSGIAAQDRVVHILNKSFPALYAEIKPGINCPACLFRNIKTWEKLIVHLNDDHIWQREAIAGYAARHGL